MMMDENCDGVMCRCNVSTQELRQSQVISHVIMRLTQIPPETIQIICLWHLTIPHADSANSLEFSSSILLE